jgi:hypothetical protein
MRDNPLDLEQTVPLITAGEIRQRQRRILDRDAAFHQSRGQWGVERLSRGHRLPLPLRFCGLRCLWKIWNEWIKGDWFHRLAYQRTIVLFFGLFFFYTAIVVFFAFIYLAVSILGQQNQLAPDGSIKIIPFCNMDINDVSFFFFFTEFVPQSVLIRFPSSAHGGSLLFPLHHDDYWLRRF